MIKVLYLFGGEKASGAEIVIDRLMRCNLDRVEAHLFISPGAYADFLLQSKPYIVKVDPYFKKLNRKDVNKILYLFKAAKNYIFLTKHIIQYILQNKIDVVHANTIVPAAYALPALLICKLMSKNVKWIWSDHDIKYFSNKDNRFAALNLKLYDATLVVSKAVRDKYSKNKKYNKVITLYNGLGLESFKPLMSSRNFFRARYQVSNDVIVFGIAGFISKRKGQLSLLQVFTDIQKKYHNVHLFIAGSVATEDSVYAEEVFSQINANARYTSYLGKIDDMLSFYNGCDIIINNSNLSGSEPLGTTIYEAMACEKIVIASNTGGSSEIVDDGIDGFLFNAEDNLDLQLKIEHCLNNYSAMENIKKNARDKVKKRFNLEEMKVKYNKILEDLTASFTPCV